MDWWSIISNTLRAGISTSAVIYALAALGLNLHFGYTGLLNFGQVGFMAAGAYGLGITTSYWNWPLWAGIIAGLACGVVLGLLLGAPTLRLRADYLAIVTIAAGEILRLVVRAARFSDVTGGSAGINGFANEYQNWNPLDRSAAYGINIGDRINLRFNGGDTWEMFTGWSLVGLGVLVMWLLVRSPWGRVLRSIREDEDAARALGKNVFRFKMQSLVLGGTFGAVGGMFFAVSNNSVQPDNYSTPVTFFALTAAIIGGLGRVLGPVVGAMIFWMILAFTDNVLRQAVGEGHIPTSVMSSVQVGQVRFILVGVLLVLLMVFRPQGLFGDKREIAIDARK
ncbi:MAG: branched-chain amino acid ABC transporter permease [Desertimonas sp.]